VVLNVADVLLLNLVLDLREVGLQLRVEVVLLLHRQLQFAGNYRLPDERSFCGTAHRTPGAEQVEGRRNKVVPSARQSLRQIEDTVQSRERLLRGAIVREGGRPVRTGTSGTPLQP